MLSHQKNWWRGRLGITFVSNTSIILAFIKLHCWRAAFSSTRFRVASPKKYPPLMRWNFVKQAVTFTESVKNTVQYSISKLITRYSTSLTIVLCCNPFEQQSRVNVTIQGKDFSWNEAVDKLICRSFF